MLNILSRIDTVGRTTWQRSLRTSYPYPRPISERERRQDLDQDFLVREGRKSLSKYGPTGI